MVNCWKTVSVAANFINAKLFQVFDYSSDICFIKKYQAFATGMFIVKVR